MLSPALRKKALIHRKKMMRIIGFMVVVFLLLEGSFLALILSRVVRTTGIAGTRISPENTSIKANGSGLEISTYIVLAIIGGRKPAIAAPKNPAAGPVAAWRENMKTRSLAVVAATKYG